MAQRPDDGIDRDPTGGKDTGGFLSTDEEWHAFTHGIYQGLTSKALVTPPVPEYDDVLKEPHYYRGGYILGTILQLAIFASTLYLGVEFTGIGIA